MKYIKLQVLLLCCLTTASFALTNYYSDGTITTGDSLNDVFAYNDASVLMGGGQVNHLDLLNTSSFEMTAGTLSGQVSVWEQSELTILDGQINASLQGSNNSIINLYGGEITDWIYAEELGIINIYGYDFAYEPLGGSRNGGQLTGRWAYGGTFALSFVDNIDLGSTYDDHVVLHEFIPEPTTLLLLGMGGLMLRKRK